MRPTSIFRNRNERSQKTKILGINCLGSYDVSAALIIDGEIVAAIEEERLNRIRHTGDFPKKSIEFCLQKAGLSINDIDVIAVSGIPKKYIFEFFMMKKYLHSH